MPDLPPILHLRHDKAPRWTDETKTHCGCDHCQHWSPLIDHLNAQLNEEGKKLLDELVTHWMHQSDDLGAANGKLAGDWPGWEAMKNFEPSNQD